jgi:hypothetical protein
MPDLSRIRGPVLAYYASGDVADDPEPAEFCTLLGTPLVVLPGDHDHAEGFNDAPTVLPIVLEFLEAQV